MYRQATKRNITSKLSSGLIVDDNICEQFIHNNNFNGLLTVLGRKKTKVRQQTGSKGTRSHKLKKANKKLMRYQLGTEQNKSNWQFRIYQPNTNIIHYFQLPAQISSFEILNHISVNQQIYCFWVRQINKKDSQFSKTQQQVDEKTSWRQYLYFIQMKLKHNQSIIQLKRVGRVLRIQQIKNECVVYANNNKQKSIDLKKYQIQKHRIGLLSINSTQAGPNYIRLVQMYSNSNKMILPIDLPHLINFNNHPKPKYIVRVTYVQFSVRAHLLDKMQEDKIEESVHIGGIWTFLSGIVSSTCQIVIIDPVILNQKSKEPIKESEIKPQQTQKQKPSRYKPIIIAYIDLPSFPSSMLHTPNDRRICLFIYTMMHNLLVWPNRQCQRKFWVEGYQLGLDQDEEILNHDDKTLEIFEQSNQDNHNEGNIEQQQEQLQHDIVEIVNKISQEKFINNKPIYNVYMADTIMEPIKDISKKTISNKSIRSSSMKGAQCKESIMQQESKQIDRQMQIIKKNNTIYLVIQTQRSTQCKLLRVLVNLQDQSAHVIKRCVFNKSSIFDVIIDSTFVQGYYIFDVYQNKHICVHPWYSQIQALNLSNQEIKQYLHSEQNNKQYYMHIYSSRSQQYKHNNLQQQHVINLKKKNKLEEHEQQQWQILQKQKNKYNCLKHGIRHSYMQNYVYIFALGNYHLCADKYSHHSEYDKNNLKYRFINKISIKNRQSDDLPLHIFMDFNNTINIINIFSTFMYQKPKDQELCIEEKQEWCRQISEKLNKERKLKGKTRRKRQIQILQLSNKKLLYMHMLEALFHFDTHTQVSNNEEQSIIQEQVVQQLDSKQQPIKKKEQNNREQIKGSAAFVESIAKHMLQLL